MKFGESGVAFFVEEVEEEVRVLIAVFDVLMTS
jgi:hypothetical protein